MAKTKVTEEDFNFLRFPGDTYPDFLSTFKNLFLGLALYCLIAFFFMLFLPSFNSPVSPKIEQTQTISAPLASIVAEKEISIENQKILKQVFEYSNYSSLSNKRFYKNTS